MTSASIHLLRFNVSGIPMAVAAGNVAKLERPRPGCLHLSEVMGLEPDPIATKRLVTLTVGSRAADVLVDVPVYAWQLEAADILPAPRGLRPETMLPVLGFATDRRAVGSAEAPTLGSPGRRTEERSRVADQTEGEHVLLLLDTACLVESILATDPGTRKT